MAPTERFYNRIIFGAVSGGTGNFVVSTAVTGYRTPATASVSNGAVVSYTAETADKSQWETGQGTYTTSTTTVARTTVRENSSGTTALIDFATAPIVRLDYHAQDITPDMWVDVRDFIADPSHFGTGFSIDEGLIIQEAIDYAFDNGKHAVFIPPGANCKVSRPIWLAPPGSYASVDPQTGGSFSDFQFTMALVGGETLGDGLYGNPTIEGYGVDGNGDIDFTNGFPDYPLLVVGPGQGMRVAGINCVAAAGSLFTTTFSPYSIGIAISGGSGGASRTMIERCWAQNLYTGLKTGWNEDSLADSNTFIKCSASGCHIGYHFRQTQNYINDLIDCSSFCPLGVVSTVGKAVNIWGGNYSFVSSNHVDFDISGTTALVSTATNAGTYLGKFTTTITFDPGDLFGFAENGFIDGGGSNPVFTAFAVETESFGIIPIQFVSYNAGTNAITVQFHEDWVLAHFGLDPDFTDTDIEAEIQACTLLYAAERAITFSGPGIHATGVHIENPLTVTCLIDNSTGSNADKLASLENIYFNWEPSVFLDTGPRKIQSVWPFINSSSSGGIRMIGGNAFGSNSNAPPPLLISARNSTDIYFEKTGMQLPNMQVCDYGDTVTNTYATYSSRARGHGRFDISPFLPQRTSGASPAAQWVTNSHGKYASLGFGPEPGVAPRITPAHYTTLSVGPPVVAALGDYPIIHGGTSYRVTDWDAGVDSTDTLFAVSDHEFYSYGQDLSINWSYKGQSHAVYMDDMIWMFSGLKIGLDNGGGVEWYVVTGVFPEATADAGGKRPGYVTTVGAANDQDPPRLVGTKTTTYTGSIVYQEEYSFTRYGGSGGGSSPGGSDTQFQYNNSSALGGANLWRASADIIEQRNTSTAQALRVYNTYTDASNYERVALKWGAGGATLAVEDAGTGSPQGLRLDVGTNSGGASRIDFNGDSSNVGFTLSEGGSAKWVAAFYNAGGTKRSFTFYNQTASEDGLFIYGDTNVVAFGITASSDLAGLKSSADVLKVVKTGDASTYKFLQWAGQARVTGNVDFTNNVTLGTVTGLSVTVIAGRTYSFDAYLSFTCAAAGGIQAAIAGSATATDIRYDGYIVDSAANGIKGNAQASALGTAVASAVTTGTAGVVHIKGTITVANAGTLLVQAAQNTTNGTATSIKRGSYFIVHDMP